MTEDQPPPIAAAKHRARQARATHIARFLAFIGEVTYRHVYSKTGGAQFRMATTEQFDLLFVFAEAFLRDADPEDFSLSAIIAHERGHQMLLRDPRLQRVLPVRISLGTEEIVASLIGSVICQDQRDQEDLYAKAIAEALSRRLLPEAADRLCCDIRTILMRYL